jgi:hypothetical protein
VSSTDNNDPNALAIILLAELHRIGLVDLGNLACIARRLELANEMDLAERVQAIPISNALTYPDAIRAGIYLINGGNSDED